VKKDINFLPVEGIQVVVARKLTELNQYDWCVYLINQNQQPIHTVFVTSTGYGEKNGEEQKTATLRHFFVSIESGANEIVETIMPDVFHLNNEYWVSYYIGSQIYDKKFIFVPDSITESHLVNIPALGLEGILHV
jgi:HEPN domain-containing protein